MKPYSDTLEHLLDELRRLDLLLRLRLEEWWAENGGAVDEFRGLYVSDDEVDKLLYSNHDGGQQTTGSRAMDDPALLERIESLARDIHERTLRTRENGTELRLEVLAELFDIGPLHRDVLLIALAPELDRKYEKIYSYLQDDVTKTRPTVDLALRVLCATETERLKARRLFSRRSALLEHRLLRVVGGEETPLPSRSISINERIVNFLLGGNDLDDDIAEFSELRGAETTVDDLAIDAERRETLDRWSEKYGSCRESNPSMVYFYGPYGSAKEVAVEALCAEEDAPVLTVDAGAIPKDATPEVSGLLVRETILQGAALHVRNLSLLSSEQEAELEALIRALDGFRGHVFLSGDESFPSELQVRVVNHDLLVLEFPIPSYELRRDLWDDVDSLPEDVNTAELAGKFRLTSGQIDDAVSVARIHANGRGLSAESVYRGCRAQSSGTLDSLARKIEPNYTWDDIVLPADALAQLREIAARIEHQGTVYSDWGFAEKFSLGNGLNVLFTGPSGTGKTMAAEIIAGEAGLDLYKIDLASVVSKYIGETEKNLGRIFDEAENSSAILLFDEADALFGKRSAVTDARDRYANIEVNYLLQRIEEHDGTVILTTNFKKNIDDAFLRRIHASVDFPLPDEEARGEIWRKVFPEETPSSELDNEFLSTFELTGGNIKNIALTAAFLALSEQRTEEMKAVYQIEREMIRGQILKEGLTDVAPHLWLHDLIEINHILRAIRREFQKTNKLVDPKSFENHQTR